MYFARGPHLSTGRMLHWDIVESILVACKILFNELGRNIR